MIVPWGPVGLTSERSTPLFSAKFLAAGAALMGFGIFSLAGTDRTAIGVLGGAAFSPF